MINRYIRYQKGLTLNVIFPDINGICACGCGQNLPNNRKKWFSNYCRDKAYLYFAVIKGDNSIIRLQVFNRDNGKCNHCGIKSTNWEADHILPVQFGGGACGLDNLQTLCIDCHKSKSYNFSQRNAISSQAASICL